MIRRKNEGTALIEARSFTGRPNQIRFHCAHLGFPICGEAADVKESMFGDTQTLGGE